MSFKALLRRLAPPPPPEPRALTREAIRRLLERHARAGGAILDLGCGDRLLPACVARLDYIPGAAGANLRADAHALPFADGAFSLVLCTAVLEHVLDYRQAIAEITRVVRPGGEIWIEVPWIFLHHPGDPERQADYIRLSATAYPHAFPAFEPLAQGPATGAGSTLSLLLPEFCALFFSQRRHTYLYDTARNLFTWLFYPLRWTDPLLAPRRFHDRIAGGFFFHGRKR